MLEEKKINTIKKNVEQNLRNTEEIVKNLNTKEIVKNLNTNKAIFERSLLKKEKKRKDLGRYTKKPEKMAQGQSLQEREQIIEKNIEEIEKSGYKLLKNIKKKNLGRDFLVFEYGESWGVEEYDIFKDDNESYIKKESKEASIKGGSTVHSLKVIEDIEYIRKKIKENDYDFSFHIFLCEVDFSEVIFKSDASFKETIFTKAVSFSGAICDGEVSFAWVIFLKEAIFSEANFYQFVNFYESRFLREAKFAKSEFIEDVDFSLAEFNREVRFNGAVFSRVWFGSVKFKEEVDFTWVHFYNKVSFSKALFEGRTDFFGTFFKDAIDFEGVRAEKGEMNFNNFKLLNNDNKDIKFNFKLSNIDALNIFPDTKENGKINFIFDQAIIKNLSFDNNILKNLSSDMSRNSLVRMKDMAISKHDKVLALGLHKLEYEKHYKDVKFKDNKVDKIILLWENWISEFGTNPLLAIIWWFNFLLVFAYIILCIVGNKNIDAIFYTFSPLTIISDRKEFLESVGSVRWVLEILTFLKTIFLSAITYEVVKSFRKFVNK